MLNRKLAILILWIGIVGIVFGSFSCQLFDSSALPSEEYTKADRQFYSVLISEKVDFIGMIDARQDLTATQKSAIKTALDSWEYMIRKAEAAQAKVGE